MKYYILICVMLAVCDALTDKEEWSNFKIKHGTNYQSAVEETRRFAIFQSNLRRIENHNEKEKQGLSTFRMGVTKFADLTPAEFKDMMKLSTQQRPKTNGKVNKIYYAGDLPSEVDWRTNGAVTEVKDQGSCGSCWSFSTTGSVEAANFIKTGKLTSLSEQNLVDCDSDCFGCFGGYMINAMEYIEKNGIMTEKDYPYTANNDRCKYNSSQVAIKISSHTLIKSGDEKDLQQAVALKGPVSVAIDASFNFQLYASGIFNDKTCGNGEFDLDHGVLCVGYGTQNGTDYWLIKNSWGLDWGESGYIRMSRNNNNQCGISTDAVYPNM